MKEISAVFVWAVAFAFLPAISVFRRESGQPAVFPPKPNPMASNDSNALIFFVKNGFGFLRQPQNSPGGMEGYSAIKPGDILCQHETRIADLSMVPVFNKPKLNGITAKVNFDKLVPNFVFFFDSFQ